MTILQFLDLTSAYFAKNGVDSPRLTAELMLAEALQKKRMQLYLEFSAEVSESVLDLLRPLVKRRAQGEPLQYIQGYAEFAGERIKVSTEVLIPRTETELLLRTVLPLINPTNAEPLCDVGTGSGILGRGLAKAHPELEIHAIDVSLSALEMARSNSVGIPNITFHHGHLLEPVPGRDFELIIANLPYIPRAVIPTLSREVRREPLVALDGGEDGLDLIRELILTSAGKTRLLALEIGNGQAEKVKNLLSESGYNVAQIAKDFSEVERIIIGTHRG